MSEIIEKVLLWALSLFLSGITTYISAMLRKQQAKQEKQEQVQEAIQHGLQCVLKQGLINEHDKWQAKGFMPVYARESFEDAYASYKGLGADGVIDGVVAETRALPVNKPKEVA